MITATVPARVGLLGNPSDGYGGKTLALTVPEFSATVEVSPGRAGIGIVPGDDDHTVWPSVDEFVDRIDRYGYGTGQQLLAAAVRTFVDVADSVGAVRPDGVEVRYRSTIPRQVGLAGSSALVIATLRCLAELTDLEIPEEILPSIALGVETEQLGITAGLQDRVVQTYGGLVAMDFSSMEVDGRFGVAFGHYERVDPSSLPPLFLAFREGSAASSGVYHGQLRSRFDQGDPVVHDTMRSLAALVTEGRAALRWHEGARIVDLIRRNMHLRRALGPLPDDQVALVAVAEDEGAAATFTGSGGAVVGACIDDEQRTAVLDAYRAADVPCLPLRPG